jgi:hypothetical protein
MTLSNRAIQESEWKISCDRRNCKGLHAIHMEPLFMLRRFRGVRAASRNPEVERGISPAQKEMATKITLDGHYLCRRRPTLPHTYACSTIGPAGLNFRVRDGNGCFPCGKITGFGGACGNFLAARSQASFHAGPVTPNLKEPSAVAGAKAPIRLEPLSRHG